MKNPFVREISFYKSLAFLAIPICLQNLITFGISFADNMMVGQLGENAIAGLYLGTLPQMLLGILIFGFENATLVLSTQYWGRGDKNLVKDSIAIGFRSGAVLATVFAVISIFFPSLIINSLTSNSGAASHGIKYLRIVGVSYLFFGFTQMLLVSMRSVESVVIGLVDSVVAFILNVALNYVFIFGKFGFPAMGVAGAAYGTVISRFVELAIVSFFVFRIDRRLHLTPRDFLRCNQTLVSDFFRYGTPIFLGQLVWSANTYGQGAIIGQMCEASMASASIADMLSRLLWMGPFGLAVATGIVTGKTIGAGEYDKMRIQARTMQVVFLGIGVLSGIFVLITRGFFISLYDIAPETVPIADKFMLVLSLIMVGRCYQAPCLMGLVKAGGDTAFVFKNDSLWVFLWILPSAFIAQRFLGAPDWLVYFLLLSDQLTKCVVAYFKVNSYNWMRNLTRSESVK